MKKLLAMLLCILMVVGLVSCGGNAETSKENSIGNEISSDASNETSEGGKTVYKAENNEDITIYQASKVTSVN